jgi:hypothetical protein
MRISQSRDGLPSPYSHTFEQPIAANSRGSSEKLV